MTTTLLAYLDCIDKKERNDYDINSIYLDYIDLKRNEKAYLDCIERKERNDYAINTIYIDSIEMKKMKKKTFLDSIRKRKEMTMTLIISWLKWNNRNEKAYLDCIEKKKRNDYDINII